MPDPDITTPSTQGARQDKLTGLELVRFLSACAVLIWHYQHFYYDGIELGRSFQTENQPLYSILFPFYNAGHYGVNLFWCISGFIFFWKYADAISSRSIGAWKFFVLRFSRLYPLHLATLLAVAGFQLLYSRVHGSYFVYPQNDIYHFILQLGLASNWGLQNDYSFNGPIWSISVEVLIYMLFYASLWALGRPRAIIAVTIALAAVGKLLRIDSPIIDCLAFFFIGGATCLFAEHVRKKNVIKPVLGMGIIALIVFPMIALHAGVFAYLPATFLFCLIYSPILIYVTSIDLRVGGGLRKAMEAAGSMTYSSYLIHFPLQLIAVIVAAMVGVPLPLNSPAFFVAYITVVLVLALVVFRYFEMPMQDAVRHRFIPSVKAGHRGGGS